MFTHASKVRGLLVHTCNHRYGWSVTRNILRHIMIHNDAACICQWTFGSFWWDKVAQQVCGTISVTQTAFCFANGYGLFPENLFVVSCAKTNMITTDYELITTFDAFTLCLHAHRCFWNLYFLMHLDLSSACKHCFKTEGFLKLFFLNLDYCVSAMGIVWDFFFDTTAKSTFLKQ